MDSNADVPNSASEGSRESPDAEEKAHPRILPRDNAGWLPGGMGLRPACPDRVRGRLWLRGTRSPAEKAGGGRSPKQGDRGDSRKPDGTVNTVYAFIMVRGFSRAPP